MSKQVFGRNRAWNRVLLEPSSIPSKTSRYQSKSWQVLLLRSLDGTELGSGFSSLLCKSCPGCLISSTDPRWKQAFIGIDTYRNTSSHSCFAISSQYFRTKTVENLVAICSDQKFLGTPPPTGSVLAATKRRKVLPVRKNWSHLKTNWRNIRIQMIWKR